MCFCPGARPESAQLPGLTNNTKVPAKGIDLEYEPDGGCTLFNLNALIRAKFNKNYCTIITWKLNIKKLTIRYSMFLLNVFI